MGTAADAIAAWKSEDDNAMYMVTDIGTVEDSKASSNYPIKLGDVLIIAPDSGVTYCNDLTNVKFTGSLTCLPVPPYPAKVNFTFAPGAGSSDTKFTMNFDIPTTQDSLVTGSNNVSITEQGSSNYSQAISIRRSIKLQRLY